MQRRLVKRLCPACGHPASQHYQRTCPECGTCVDKDLRRRIAVRLKPSDRRVPAVLLTLGAVSNIVLAIVLSDIELDSHSELLMIIGLNFALYSFGTVFLLLAFGVRRLGQVMPVLIVLGLMFGLMAAILLAQDSLVYWMY